MRRGQVVLGTCAIIPVMGMVCNVVVPPETNAYFPELFLLLILALIALVISCKNVNVAVAFFFSAAHVPILIAMARSSGDGQIVWAAAPFVFILLVAALTMNANTVIFFAIPAMIANYAAGIVYGNVGLVGALVFFSVSLSAALYYWLTSYEQRLREHIQEHDARIEKLEREV